MNRKRRRVWKYREPGRPFWRLAWTDERGKRRRESTGTDHEAEAETLRADKECDLNNGRVIAPDETRWEDFTEAYMDEEFPRLSKHARSKRLLMMANVERILEPVTLDDLTARAVNRLVAAWRREGKKESTVHGNLAHLQPMLRWAHSQGMLTTVPEFPRVKPPKGAARKRIRIAARINTEHFERLVMSAPEPWLRLMIALCWHCGMRRTEALSVHGEHVHLDEHYIAIPNNKAGDEDATVVIPPDLDAVLREMYPTGRLPHGRLMPDRDPRNVSKSFCRVAEKAGVRGNGAVIACPKCKGTADASCKRCGGSGRVGGFCTFQDLRRAFGSRWAAKVPAQVLQRMMRHADIKTTMEFYADVEASIMAMYWPAETEVVPEVVPPNKKRRHEIAVSQRRGRDSNPR